MNQQRRQSTESNPSRIASVLEEYLTHYSLGETLYEMLWDGLLSSGTMDRLLARKICETHPISLRQHDARIPHNLETIVLKCLSKSPHERYQTAGE